MKETTTALSVRSGPRCGLRGIGMYGLHFTPTATLVPLASLPESAARRILAHAELIVEEIADAPAPKKAAAKPAAPPKPAAAPKKKRKKKQTGD